MKVLVSVTSSVLLIAVLLTSCKGSKCGTCPEFSKIENKCKIEKI